MFEYMWNLANEDDDAVCRLCGQYAEDDESTSVCVWCGAEVSWGTKPYAWTDNDGYVRCADARHMHQGTEGVGR